ncbi:unnamed protein product [Acanthoscelides obtectus]|uniref:Zinc finger PHD-type domain-containing protein n=1 Tax=Acanthoscelides obtectus TaxID=200917 RepID=A0A9P0MJU6_ACAOB|nr:unnamed protein product [Acanthoscelides obtectus]CAK1645767.1 hypothetical protein AOBTE_LOCUS14254 [Acanthoscelides obtectus]
MRSNGDAASTRPKAAGRSEMTDSGIVKTAFDIAVTITNVTAGFRTTGIWPLNTEIFREEEFLPSQVTDRALPPTVLVHEDSVVQTDDPEIPRTSREAERTPSPPINDSLYYNHTVSNTNANAEVSCTSTILSSNQDDAPTPDSLYPVPLTSKVSITSAGISEVSSTSNTSTVTTAVSVFSPEAIRPLPQAEARKNTQKRRKIKSAILTDTPVKNELEAIEARRNTKKVKRPALNLENKTKKSVSKTRRNCKNKGKISEKESSDSDDGDCFCVVCMESFSQSVPKEEWIQCIECKSWAHLACTEGDLFYVCHNCFSE